MRVCAEGAPGPAHAHGQGAPEPGLKPRPPSQPGALGLQGDIFVVQAGPRLWQKSFHPGFNKTVSSVFTSTATFCLGKVMPGLHFPKCPKSHL